MPVATPFLCVDRDRLDANISRVSTWASDRRVALRPHAKTHKSPAIAARQLAAGAVGLTVATVGEAEVFADHGASDLFIAYPLWVDDDRARRIRGLAGRVRLGFGVDSPEGATRAGRLLRGADVEVLVEVDSGHHRTGVPPGGVASVAQAVLDAGLTLTGVFSFPGHSYQHGALRTAAQDEAAALGEAAESLRRLGVDPVVSGGSSPSLRESDVDVLTEVRPGVYVFGDAQQWELGAITADAVALTCHATVISRRGRRVVLDSGSKVLGADRAPWATGFGRLLDEPAARIALLSEHHAVVEWPDSRPPSLGTVVRVVPNHVCASVNLADEVYLDEGGRLTAWPIAARGQNA